MTKQQRIIETLGVSSRFDVAQEARQRIDFLAAYLRASGLGTYVLGISG
jgi:NAD+ synthase